MVWVNTGRSLPPLLVVKCLVPAKFMVDVSAEARNSFIVVEAGMEARGWKLEAGKAQMAGCFPSSIELP
jgi:hypothetical protein